MQADSEINGQKEWTEKSFIDGSPSQHGLPFSFKCGSKSSDQLLKKWPRSIEEVPSTSAGKRVRKLTWTDPVTGLEVTCELTQFDDAPATDWVVTLTNKGKEESPLIEGLQGMDTVLPLQNPVVRSSKGSANSPNDFIPGDQGIPDRGLVLSAVNGRSSQAVLPFFNLFDKQAGGGFMLGIGWSGQWEVDFNKTQVEQPNQEVHLSAFQQHLRVKLQPGESIRTPRILLVGYKGPDAIRGHNLLRKILLKHYVPQQEGKPAVPPIAAMTWFTYGSGSGVTEANQLEAIATMAPFGVEDFWLDAGWYGDGDWSRSVGSWNARKDVFPRGLKPLSDASHAAGMKMVTWFEPERVQKNTTIAREHPEFVHGGANGGLFKLDDPAARRWMTQLLSDHIRNDGFDVLRIDYNLDPLSFWQAADGPDRQGMTENLYIQGLYAMWDELRRNHPGLLIDDCASGGRRIDLETVSRSIPLWRSDYPCAGPHPTADQAGTAGLSLWVPLHTGGLWAFDPYTARSIATAGTAICADLRNKKFRAEDIERTITEIKSLRDLWMGDYYPLTPIGLDDSKWIAWQFDRPDIGKGFVMIFRRPGVKETSFTASLLGLDPASNYEVQFKDSGKTLNTTGKQLSSLQIEVPVAPSAMLVTYEKVLR